MFGKWLVPVLGGCIMLASFNWLLAPVPPSLETSVSFPTQSPAAAGTIPEADRALDIFVGCLQNLATADLLAIQPVQPVAGSPPLDRLVLYRQLCFTSVVDVHWAPARAQYGRRTVSALLGSVDAQLRDAALFLQADDGGPIESVAADVVWRAAFDRAAAYAARFHLELLEFYSALERSDAP